jgi:hypothetical protein
MISLLPTGQRPHTLRGGNAGVKTHRGMLVWFDRSQYLSPNPRHWFASEGRPASSFAECFNGGGTLLVYATADALWGRCPLKHRCPSLPTIHLHLLASTIYHCSPRPEYSFVGHQHSQLVKDHFTEYEHKSAASKDFCLILYCDKTPQLSLNSPSHDFHPTYVLLPLRTQPSPSKTDFEASCLNSKEQRTGLKRENKSR